MEWSAEMSSYQRVLDNLGRLSSEQQEQVLRLIESLAQQGHPRMCPTNPIGLWADSPNRISEEEIDAARREMWGNFPREDIV